MNEPTGPSGPPEGWDRPVRFALVGYGGGGRFFHAPVVAGAPGCELVAVVTSDGARAQQARDEHGVRVVGSVEELGALGVDVVAVSTPAATHTELTDRVLRAGLPVVCDKPFALDAASAAATADLADELGLLVAPYQNRRFDSDLLTVQRVLADGELGSVHRFESSFERWAAGHPPAAGGGLLRDFGAHLVDQALLLFGDVVTVTAQARGATGAEDAFRLQLRHVGGVVSELSGDWHQAVPGPRFRVSGERGTFVVEPAVDGQEAALVAGRTPAGEGDAWGVEAPSRWGSLTVGAGPARRVPSEAGAWPTFYARVADAVRGRGPLPVTARDAVRTCAVVDAAHRAAASGETVRLEGRDGGLVGWTRSGA